MKQQPPPTVDNIHPSDVLLGRGKLVHFHAGNVQYRNMVKASCLEYQAQTGLEKDSIAAEIIKRVSGGGGRFLRRDGFRWEECSALIARTKVKQALRDFAKVKTPKRESPPACRNSDSRRLDTSEKELGAASGEGGNPDDRLGDIATWDGCSVLQSSLLSTRTIPWNPVHHLVAESSQLPTFFFSGLPNVQLPAPHRPPPQISIDGSMSLLLGVSTPAVFEPSVPAQQHELSSGEPVGGVVWLQKLLRSLGRHNTPGGIMEHNVAHQDTAVPADDHDLRQV